MGQERERTTAGQSGWLWLQSWKEGEERTPCLVYFRKKLELEAVPARCTVKVSADSRYKLYVNGNFVEAGPCKGDNSRWNCDEIDLTPYLWRGENVVAAAVLRYPPLHGEGNYSVFRTDTPGFYMAAETEPEVWAKYPWKCKRVSGFRIVRENPYFAPLQIYEEAQGDEEDHGWAAAGYEDSDWEMAREVSDENMAGVLWSDRLGERPIPFLKRVRRKFLGVSNLAESIHSKAEWEQFLKGAREIRIPSDTAESVEIDAGELMTGYLRLRLTGGKGARIVMLQSECYAGEMKENREDPFKTMPLKKNRSDAENGKLYGYSDNYLVSGIGSEEKPEEYEPFWFRTFRYIRLQVETKDEPLTLRCFDYEEMGYPLDIRTRVETSDPEMGDIWELCARTLRRCMHETYEDCPFYEQLQYAMDSRSQMLYTYAIAGDDRLARKCMRDFRHSVRSDGMINCSYPNFETNVIPGFAIYYIGMLYDHMMYFGDKSFLGEHLEVVEGILNFFESRLDERGIVGKIGGLNRPDNYWSFIDWAPEWDGTNGVPPATLKGPITMESFLYMMGLQYGAAIMRWLGKSELAEVYEERAERVQSGVKRFCMGENGMYQDGPGIETYSQHCQVFAILTGTLPAKQGGKILLETLRNKEQYAQCTVAMMFYFFRALEKCDLYEYTDGLWDVWREMLANNMTTCAEDPLMSRSDCHAWGALALYELPAAVLGVRPAKPGYEEIEVKPQCGKFTWARGEVITPKGVVRVGWEKGKDGTFDLQVEAPEGTLLRKIPPVNTGRKRNQE